MINLIIFSLRFVVIGQTMPVQWTKLYKTAKIGDKIIQITSSLNPEWIVNSQIAISATNYFDKVGNFWDDSTTPANEMRIIQAITTIWNVVEKMYISTITLNNPLLQTHLCMIILEETFCGYVGLITKNIVFKAADLTENNVIGFGNVFGFGGHIFVTDLYDPAICLNNPHNFKTTRVGTVILESVQIENFGQMNNQYNAITINYRDDYSNSPYLNYTSNSFTNCSFYSSFNYPLQIINFGFDVEFSGNVLMESYSGGVFIPVSESVYIFIRLFFHQFKLQLI